MNIYSKLHEPSLIKEENLMYWQELPKLLRINISLVLLFSHEAMSKYFATQWIVVCQAPLSMEFSRHKCWSGLPFSSPGDLPDAGIESIFPALAVVTMFMRERKTLHNLSCYCCSVAKSYLTICNPTDCSTTCSSVPHFLREIVHTSVHWDSGAIWPSHPLLPLPILSSMLTSMRVFFNELAICISWPKYWSFSFSISTSKEHSGLTSLRIDWFDRLAVKGTLKSPLQHHMSNTSILPHSGFFVVQLSGWYLTTGKNIALTVQTFVSKMMSLLFNVLSRFVIVFLPQCKGLLISWLQ